MLMLDYYDENKNYLGIETNEKVHTDALWHNTVHCWLYNDGKIFFQRVTDSDILAVPAAGHVISAESIKEAFGREIFGALGTKIDYEEATLCNVETISIDKIKADGSVFKDRVFANVYLYRYNKDYDFKFDMNELTGLVCVNAADLLELFTNEEGTIKGEEITNINGEIVTTIKDIDFNEFLVNENETALTKYKTILDKVVELSK